jgi:hypothetical protein
MTSQTQTIDFAKLTAAVAETKRAASFWQHPSCQLHLDHLLLRETLRQLGTAA